MAKKHVYLKVKFFHLEFFKSNILYTKTERMYEKTKKGKKSHSNHKECTETQTIETSKRE